MGIRNSCKLCPNYFHKFVNRSTSRIINDSFKSYQVTLQNQDHIYKMISWALSWISKYILVTSRVLGVFSLSTLTGSLVRCWTTFRFLNLCHDTTTTTTTTNYYWFNHFLLLPKWRTRNIYSPSFLVFMYHLHLCVFYRFSGNVTNTETISSRFSSLSTTREPSLSEVRSMTLRLN